MLSILTYKERKGGKRTQYLVVPSSIAQRTEMDSFVYSSLNEIMAFSARNVNLANVQTKLTQHITENNYYELWNI